ncbi:MAG: dephospho-CoA kinase [Acidobacteriota bacterium]|nr:dephospho-CoA kinase [Acidobacteriota bacterium]
MLRVGLTGGLGSGKSTAARLFVEHGAHLLSSDEIGRELMQPGQPVYSAILQHFGPRYRRPDGQLDRPALAHAAFAEGRVEELNAIVHPAVIAEQQRRAEELAAREPHAVLLVESALLLETRHAGPGGLRGRFDRIVLVTAPDESKIARFLARSAAGRSLTPEQRDALTAEAHRRLDQQMPDEQKASLCDYVLHNDGSLAELEWQIDQLWPLLQQQAAAVPSARPNA